MGIRYRKVISVTPWLRVNVSKTGLSLSVGPKGSSVNMNKNDYIVNGNLPGGLRLQKHIPKGKK